MNKKFTKLIAALALLMLLIPLRGWGQSVDSYTATDADKPSAVNGTTTGSVTGTNSISWSYSVTQETKTNKSPFVGYNSSYGWQLGSSNSPCKAFSISTSGISGIITQIQTETGSKNASSTISVTVGGEAFGTQNQATGSGSTVATQTFSGSASGDILVSASASSEAFYFKSVTVTYTSGGQTSTYTVTYNANGATSGTVPTDNTAYTSGATVTVLGNTGNLEKEHYTCTKWNTKADGTGTNREFGGTFNITMNSMLYAKWEINTHNVTLPANDEYGTYSLSYTYNNATVILPTAVPYNVVVTLIYTPAEGYENYEAIWSMNGTAISNNKFNMPDEDVSVTVILSPITAVTDVLNREFTGIPNQSGSNVTYKDWSGKKSISTAVYAGQSAGDKNSIQLRATNPSGIVTTTSGGKVKKITVTWNSNTSNERVLDIYGKNTPYSQPADLYGNNKGTKLGSIAKSNSTELTIDGNYTYIGLRSNSGAMYLDKIEIKWADDYSATTNVAAHTENAGWYFIASPFAANQSLTWDSINSHIRSTDTVLYYYDEATHYWRNIKVAANAAGFNYANGTGYLYANRDNVTLTFAGTSLVEGNSKDINLSYTAAAAPLDGWNLVGNPFNSNATLNMDCFIIEGLAINTTAQTAGTYTVKPCEGVMVKATTTGQKVTFTKVTNSQTPQPTQLQVTVAQQVMNRGAVTSTVNDNVIVNFNEGSLLEKFSFNADAAKLYIPQNDKEYAIVSAEAQGEMPLNFRANADGQYTLTVNPEGIEMNYLHLIDNMTGANIDLLSTPSYTFTAKTTDYESRFRLVFASSTCEDANVDNETFAFFSNGNLIVNGEGMLQVIDMLGRVVCTHMVTPNFSLPTPNYQGVYVLRLVNGNDVKTQKIVVK